jgi:TolB-like protein
MKRDEVAFGPFRLDVGRGELTRNGIPVQISGRALDILSALADAKGEAVTKDQLIAQVWPGIVVGENNLHVHISALRKSLDDGGGGQRYVRTVQRRGYRLVDGHYPLQAEGHIQKSSQLDRPSIAVLPFANLGNEPEQEYFADGIVEDITVALSRMRWLLVIARNSSFTYKGRPVDVRHIGSELGVRYVLEGSVRKVANRVRITTHLIETSTAAHLWAEQFDGALQDIFDLQDRVSTSVAAAIAPKLEQSEIERAANKPTESLDAYDHYLRGMASVHQWRSETNSEALRSFYRAVDLDDTFASAYGMAAWCYARRKSNRWMIDPKQESAETARLARRAVDTGKEDAVALYAAGFALARVNGALDEGAAFIDRAIALNRNLAPAWLTSGWVRVCLGEPDAAVAHVVHAMRLSPIDPYIFGMQSGIAFAHLFARRYDEASSWAEKALRVQVNWIPALRIAAASYALGARLGEARDAMRRMRQLDPGLRVSNLQEVMPFRRVADLALFAEGLRKAGLPQ